MEPKPEAERIDAAEFLCKCELLLFSIIIIVFNIIRIEAIAGEILASPIAPERSCAINRAASRETEQKPTFSSTL